MTKLGNIKTIVSVSVLPVLYILTALLFSGNSLFPVIVIFLSLINAGVFLGLLKKRNQDVKKFSDIVKNNFGKEDEQTDSSVFLSRHVMACKQSRMDTAAIIKENNANSASFAENFKDSVFLTTTINGSVQNIHDRISELNNSLQESSSAIEEISSTVIEFARQIENQSSSVIQTSTAVEQMDANIRNVSQITDRKEESSRQLIKLAEKSQGGMQEMNKKIEIVNNNIGSVQEIINVIDSIASQTNLLSMNAAIEAAHAGDAGKGFAVVAGEIRKLAESTASNSKLISETLKNIVENVKEVSHAGQENSADFDSIKTEIEEMVRAFREISNATSELSVGSHEIVSATQMLNDISGSISSGSREISHSTTDIRDSLTTIVGASRDSESEIENINQISQKLNLMFLSVSNAFLKYEEYLEKIQEFQKSEFGSNKSSFSAIKMILQHLSWVIRARGVIDNTMQVDIKTMKDHHSCLLGHWIDVEASDTLKRNESFKVMEVNHEKLHSLVREIIEGKERFSHDEIEKKYKDLLDISEHIIKSLLDLGQNH